jgi:hypothetical protein
MTSSTLRSESEALASRLVSCLAGATFEMETLVRLAGIEASREIPTAAVTCEGRPRLLINPDFVAKHCAREEHLFLLVMHELWHVILAHTRLYPRATPEQNVAFDAVINAGLCVQFPGVEYRGFFESLNPADEFPACLLRPPPGWPSAPDYGVARGPRGLEKILERLYPKFALYDDLTPSYDEILALLQRARADEEEKEDKDERAWPAEPVLLGDHEDPESDARAVADSRFGDVVRRIVAAWPPPPIPIGGRDLGGETQDWLRALGPVPEAAQRVFSQVLRRALGCWPGAARSQRRSLVVRPGGVAPIPSARDRLAPARRALGLSDVLQVQEARLPTRVPNTPSLTHVYIDVSGSMDDLLPHLLGLLWPHVAAGRTRVFQFSTVVELLTREALRSGRVTTTGGTDIACVHAHALGVPRLRRLLLLTDGYVGETTREHAESLRERGIELHVVLPAESAYVRDLEPVARSITVLPPLWGERGTR